jgi:hypothetical protein
LIDRVLSLPERRAATIIVAIGTLFALAYGASLVLKPKPGGRIVIGDALHHYVQLRSPVFDGDLHFRNDYIRLYGLQGGEPGTGWVYEDTPTAHVRNLMPVGPAILWLPLFLIVTAAASLANLAGGAIAVDGYGRLFQATAGFSGIAAATMGVWLTWRACGFLFSARASAWAALVLWVSSSAVYYSLVSPTYSHAASLLATSAFWYAWIRTGQGRSTTNYQLPTSNGTKRYALLGVCAGIAALMRWQDAILLAPVALDLLVNVRTGKYRLPQAARLGIVAFAAAAVAFIPQMIVWMVLYGQPLALPQGAGFMRWTEPALWSVLFSDWHGLFTWTPVVAVALIGLMPLARKHGTLAAGAILFLALSWYVNAAVADWWAGEAFGSRRFVSCFPVFALALAALIDWWAPTLRKLALAATVIVVHTGLLFVQYQAFMHGLRDVAPYPRGAYNLWVARFVVPFDLLREWLSR